MKSQLHDVLGRLGVTEFLAVATGHDWFAGAGSELNVVCPIDGDRLASFAAATRGDVDTAVNSATRAFGQWRAVPAPKRGEVVRLIGEKLRQHKADLALLVSLETGKILEESAGEVQEMIDICDFAVGLSRQLYGLSIASERSRHRLAEQWHPLGAVGVITAFNFPVAVWAWNAMIALVCGDSLVWKPSEKTPLSAMACQRIASGVLAQMPGLPANVVNLVIGTGLEVGQALAASPDLPLISATGSIPMGRSVAQAVAGRLGRSLLELGGNNGAIVTPSADLELALRAIVFAAAGTCGQRCTTLRRLIVHHTIADQVLARLLQIYRQLPIGNPLQKGILVGPLIDERAAEQMAAA
jgi:aldehyde dehydrogenase (NAD+)